MQQDLAKRHVGARSQLQFRANVIVLKSVCAEYSLKTTECCLKLLLNDCVRIISQHGPPDTYLTKLFQYAQPVFCLSAQSFGPSLESNCRLLPSLE